MQTRHTFTAALLVALLAIAGVSAAIAADPAEPPPPRIAFLANGRVPADALAAGPIAGQLGAPVYTTEQDALPDSTANALDDYTPELVIVMGGTVAISDAVVAAVADATGLPVVDPTPPPTTGVVRAAGADRFVTATVVADLLSAYDPAYLGVDLRALDADLLDGKDSSAFLGKAEKASDSDKLDGMDATDFEASGTAPLLFSDEVTSSVSFADTVPHTVQSMDVTVPGSGSLVITVSMMVENDELTNRLAALGWVELTGPSPDTSVTFIEGLTAEPNESWQRTMSYTVTFPVAAGTHTVNTIIESGTSPVAYTIRNRALTVEFYPESQVG